MAPASVDETEPLLGLGATAEFCREGPGPGVHSHRRDDIVDFDPEGDPENPREWTVAFKWGITLLLTFLAFTV